MQWGLGIAVAAVPFVIVTTVWADRIRTGEFRRLWRPFWRALRSGYPPADVDPREWTDFLALRQRRTMRALLTQPVLLTFTIAPHWLNKTGFSDFQLIYIGLIVLSMVQLTVRLSRIERLTTAAEASL